MRKVPTYVGATTGNNGRTEGLPEVQESVLEHAAPETQNAQVTDETLSQNSDVVNLVTNVTGIRKTDDIVRKQFVYEMRRDNWENPGKIQNLRVNLPNGLSARFARIETWEMRPYKPLA